MARKDKEPDNSELLNSFWRRNTFHDMPIESINRVSGRVNVVLDEYVLSLANATKFIQKIDEFPDVWLYEKLKKLDAGLQLTVTTGTGSFVVNFVNIRLVRRLDYAILIPPVDG